MKYVQCSRCRARFHIGLIYDSPRACARCGAPLSLTRWRFGVRAREVLKRSRVRDSLDWEAITGSQYIRRPVRAKDPGQNGGTASPA
ncbi:MAG: hypothetical protein JO244_11395 [Solirubrobacterales bacterium]|nr:hypothetical protein [Solirubrobacterales bacterium]